MSWIVVAMALWLLSGGLSLAARSARRSGTFGATGSVLASILAAVPAVLSLAGHAPAPVRLAWSVPYGSCSLALDGLSAVFLLPVLLLSALCAVFGRKYLLSEDRPLGPAWFFYNLLVASMVGVLIARNGVLFLIAWELMALASYFLVVHHSERPEVRRAGWIYLLATHLGSALLLPMFVLLAHGGTSLDFDRMAAGPAVASAIVAMAVVGFGSKAGFVPFHIWLPEAHPAAPSHVSALMSGIMIELGLYGLLRVLLLLGAPQAAWGWALLAIGLVSGVYGALMTLAQRDLKRLLAFSSVDNVGIAAMGIGMGLLGRAEGNPALTVLGFAGALLHVLNHAAFKGLLFLGSGAIQHATGTRQADRLGGLIKAMPVTAAALLVGAAALAGLPPLCGFAGEFTIFLGALGGLRETANANALPLLLVVAGLALIGGTAVASLSGSFGVVFLGEPRTPPVRDAHEPGPAMVGPMAVLAALCGILGLGAPGIALALGPEISQLSGLPQASVGTQLAVLAHSLFGVDAVFCAIAIAFLALWGIRRRLLASHAVDRSPTWGCGYPAPTARMQYTSASFAMPLIAAFGPIAGPRSTSPYARGYGAVRRMAGRLRWLQNGNLQIYVLYIALTLLVLLVGKLGIEWH